MTRPTPEALASVISAAWDEAEKATPEEVDGYARDLSCQVYHRPDLGHGPEYVEHVRADFALAAITSLATQLAAVQAERDAAVAEIKSLRHGIAVASADTTDDVTRQTLALAIRIADDAAKASP